MNRKLFRFLITHPLWTITALSIHMNSIRDFRVALPHLLYVNTVIPIPKPHRCRRHLPTAYGGSDRMSGLLCHWNIIDAQQQDYADKPPSSTASHSRGTALYGHDTSRMRTRALHLTGEVKFHERVALSETTSTIAFSMTTMVVMLRINITAQTLTYNPEEDLAGTISI